MEISKNDIALMRQLGQRYMEIASLPIQREKMELWKALNRGDRTRPMVVIDQLPWNELKGDRALALKAEDPFLRGLEWQMRSTLFAFEYFPVDMVVEPLIKIPFSAENTGFGMGVEETTAMTDSDNAVLSHSYQNQFEEEGDEAKIKDAAITLNREESARRLEISRYLFDGIAPVIQRGGVYARAQVWDAIAEWMNVENVYYDLIDRPEFIHKIVNRATESVLAAIRQINELGLADDTASTCHCSYVYNDTLLPDFGAGKGPHTKNAWSCAMAQLFTSASPAVTEEFEVPYISRIAQQYGMFYYGCCERLDDRLEIVQKIPNVKKISCSPWSNRDAFAEKLRKDLIMSVKPSPAFLAGDVMDETLVREDLRRSCQAAKNGGVNAELVLKDVSTVRHDPARLNRWAEIAMEVVEEF